MKKRSDEKTDEKMTVGDVASVREHVLSPEEYLSQIEFLDDDFEFQHKDGFEHVDTNFASQSYWKEAMSRRDAISLRMALTILKLVMGRDGES